MQLISSIGNRAFDAALALVFPQSCAVCGQSVESRHDGIACAQCWHATQIFRPEENVCEKCGALSLAPASRKPSAQIRCGRCDEDGFTHARACGPYENALRASVLELKRRPYVFQRLARLLLEAQQREPLKMANVIVPVPLHAERERERGFNQAAIIARELARLSGLALDEHSVVRRLHTERHRAGMDAKARRKSVAGAFAVRHRDLITGQRVLLIDDVFTTGATASACAQELKDSGAAEVFILTIARA